MKTKILAESISTVIARIRPRGVGTVIARLQNPSAPAPAGRLETYHGPAMTPEQCDILEDIAGLTARYVIMAQYRPDSIQAAFARNLVLRVLDVEIAELWALSGICMD